MKDLSIDDINIDNISNDDINKFKIIKNPYESNAINLIDQFLVLGHQKNFIKKEFPKIIEREKHNLQNKNYIEIPIKEKIEILNEINFKKDKLTLNYNNDLLINIIFPNNSTLIIMNKNYQKEEILPYKVIFSSLSSFLQSAVLPEPASPKIVMFFLFSSLRSSWSSSACFSSRRESRSPRRGRTSPTRWKRSPARLIRLPSSPPTTSRSARPRPRSKRQESAALTWI